MRLYFHTGWEKLCLMVHPENILSNLTLEIMDYPKWTGLSGNSLDFAYESSADIHSGLDQFAQTCIAAAQMNSDACPFATKSMKTSNPSNDIVNRIDDIVAKFTQMRAVNDTQGMAYDLLFVNEDIATYISNPDAWYNFATYLVTAEDLVQNQSSSSSRVKRASGATSSLTYASYNWTHFETGGFNDFHQIASMCLDNSYNTISTQSAFISYLDEFISEDTLRGYNPNMFMTAACLSWPNLTNADIEKYNDTFPNLTNRILLVAPMYGAMASLAGISNTYNFVGSENANILLHDGFGDGYNSDPNNCTVNAITQFYLEAIYSSSQLIKGTLPPNGTTCTTDHTGENNPIYAGYLASLPPTNSNHNIKLALGLGLGIGLPVLIGLAVFLWYWFFVRKEKKVFVPRPKYIPKDPPGSGSREQSYPERPESTATGDHKDKSLFTE
jgi:hypothetical protein